MLASLAPETPPAGFSQRQGGILVPEFDRRDGKRLRRFGETYILQTKGRWAGEPLEHEPWQVQLTDELFLRRANGERVYKEALVGISRKNGKSTLGSELALYGLVGSREQSPEVYAAAAARDQAGIVFNQAKEFVEASPRLLDYLRPFRSRILCPHNKGVFRVLASDAPLQYGLNPSMVVIDELWAHANPELYYALTTGSLARESPLIVSITTAGFDRDSVCYTLYERGRKLRAQGGIEAMREEGFLFWWYEMPASELIEGVSVPVDYRDERHWKAANPSSWITIENLRHESKRLPESVFRRLHLNQWTETEDAWIRPFEWDALRWHSDADDDPYERLLGEFRDQPSAILWRKKPAYARKWELHRQDPAVNAMPNPLGADGSKLVTRYLAARERLERQVAAGSHGDSGFFDFGSATWMALDVGIKRDSAGIVMVQWHGDKLHARATILKPEEQGPRWGVADVRAKVRDVASQLTDLREIVYDPWSFRESAEMLMDEGLPMLEFPQNASRMGPASETLYELVVSNRLRHEGDEEMRKQALAAVVGPTEKGGWRISKRKSLERIDATIALAMAADRAVTMRNEKRHGASKVY